MSLYYSLLLNLDSLSQQRKGTTKEREKILRGIKRRQRETRKNNWKNKNLGKNLEERRCRYSLKGRMVKNIGKVFE